MTKIEEIQIEWDGKPAVMKVKEFTWREGQACAKEAADIMKEKFGEEEAKKKDMDLLVLYDIRMKNAIVEAPFPFETVEDIGNLPEKIGNLLFVKVNKTDRLDGETRKNSGTPSTVKK